MESESIRKGHRHTSSRSQTTKTHCFNYDKQTIHRETKPNIPFASYHHQHLLNILFLFFFYRKSGDFYIYIFFYLWNEKVLMYQGINISPAHSTRVLETAAAALQPNTWCCEYGGLTTANPLITIRLIAAFTIGRREASLILCNRTTKAPTQYMPSYYCIFFLSLSRYLDFNFTFSFLSLMSKNHWKQNKLYLYLSPNLQR